MSIFFELIFFWIFNSGNFHTFILILGALSIFGSFYLYNFLIKRTFDFLDIKYDKRFHLFKDLKFLFFTAIDIFKSSFCVMKKFFQKECVIDDICEIDLSVISSEKTISAIAHYITATPGSLTIEQLDGKKFLIHCLYKQNFDDMLKFKDEARIIKIFLK